ncbi:siderophore-interacting protein [Leptospira sp. 'Mane']|uniref:siderophore-interacting protein n=1 Tax=Leptospira sp. 'Mane' TaxID=3387407 RepID=UPI00398A55A8
MGLKEGVISVVEKVLNFSTAKVVRVKVLSDEFRLVEWEASGFKKSDWKPGDKIQIGLNLQFRTYTPLSLDKTSGRMEALTYFHNPDSLAGTWIQSLKIGDEFQYFGPRGSLSFSECNFPNIYFFGDETSFGIASNLKQAKPEAKIKFFFEVARLDSAKAVTNELKLGDIGLFQKEAEDSHLKKIILKLQNESIDYKNANFILTGKAQSIQIVLPFLKKESVPSRNMKVKAYWSLGKKGLD